MKNIVSLPFISLYPCANWPSSLHIPFFYIFLSGPLIKLVYFSQSGVSMWSIVQSWVIEDGFVSCLCSIWIVLATLAIVDLVGYRWVGTCTGYLDEM